MMTLQQDASKYQIQDILREFLVALGFEAMARDVMAEHDHGQLCKYARVVLRNLPEPQRREVYRRFLMLRLA